MKKNGKNSPREISNKDDTKETLLPISRGKDNKGRILTLQMIETGLEEARKLSGFPRPAYPPWLADKLDALFPLCKGGRGISMANVNRTSLETKPCGPSLQGKPCGPSLETKLCDD